MVDIRPAIGIEAGRNTLQSAKRLHCGITGLCESNARKFGFRYNGLHDCERSSKQSGTNGRDNSRTCPHSLMRDDGTCFRLAAPVHTGNLVQLIQGVSTRLLEMIACWRTSLPDSESLESFLVSRSRNVPGKRSRISCGTYSATQWLRSRPNYFVFQRLFQELKEGIRKGHVR